MKGKETSHVKAFMDSKLESGETYIATLDGYIGKMMGSGEDKQHNGNLVVTDRRVVFFRKGIFGHVFQTIPVDKITSIETKSLLGHRVMTLHTSHDELSFKTMESAELFREVHDRIEELRTAVPRNQSSTSEWPVDPRIRLERLKAMFTEGLFTEEEYQSQRQKILSEL